MVKYKIYKFQLIDMFLMNATNICKHITEFFFQNTNKTNIEGTIL